MSDAAAVKPKKTAKPKKPAAHPKYIEMIGQAISSLKERGGSSRQAILKYIMANFNVGKDSSSVNVHLKMALRTGAKKGTLKQAKGTGASGSFKLGDTPKEKKSKAKKPAAAKPKAVKKPAAKKAAGEKKPKAKKPKTPKKKAAAKPKKSPAKKAAKPKKSPAKKAAKKPKSPKKVAKKAAKK